MTTKAEREEQRYWQARTRASVARFREEEGEEIEDWMQRQYYHIPREVYYPPGAGRAKGDEARTTETVEMADVLAAGAELAACLGHLDTVLHVGNRPTRRTQLRVQAALTRWWDVTESLRWAQEPNRVPMNKQIVS